MDQLRITLGWSEVSRRPALPYLFLLAIEMLAIIIRENKEIKRTKTELNRRKLNFSNMRMIRRQSFRI